MLAVLLAVAVITALQSCHGQVTMQGLLRPATQPKAALSATKTYSLPPVSNQKLLLDTLANDTKTLVKPYKFAQTFDFLLDITKDGEWTEHNSTRCWRAKIVSTDATSLSLIFDKFSLPRDAELYVVGKTVSRQRLHSTRRSWAPSRKSSMPSMTASLQRCH